MGLDLLFEAQTQAAQMQIEGVAGEEGGQDLIAEPEESTRRAPHALLAGASASVR